MCCGVSEIGEFGGMNCMRKYSVDLNLDMGEGFGLWMIGDGVDE